ncbi:MAG: Dam family site-specific DNA-(adenine-N6)-methyltransferase [Polyangiaceae bacterium]|nr:Dam family site-specific DNA-(adenine-N6)-methyltransferase [Polyangiaceae bacterium]
MSREARAGKPLTRAPHGETRAPGADAGLIETTSTRPFLKWAGGKRRLLPELVRHLPSSYGTYYEPFLGGGALFFHLRPRRAVLGDANARLVRAYTGVRDSVDEVVRILRSYPPTRDTFEALRARDIDQSSDAEVAAWFVFLNRLGYNGLYRVNRAGRFNVPFGDYANPRVCDEATLRACSAALAGAELVVSDFAEVAAEARRGDLAYFDPPYVPLSATASFTSYTSKGFSPADQERLRDQARALAARGVTALISNSSAPAVHELYASDDFALSPVQAARRRSRRRHRARHRGAPQACQLEGVEDGQGTESDQGAESGQDNAGAQSNQSSQGSQSGPGTEGDQGAESGQGTESDQGCPQGASAPGALRPKRAWGRPGEPERPLLGFWRPLAQS